MSDGTLKLDFFHSGPPELIAQCPRCRPFEDYALVTPRWHENLLLTRRFWFPTFRQEWECAATLDSAGRVTGWNTLPPISPRFKPTGRRATFRCTHHEIPLSPLALPALPALWVLSRDIIRACRKAHRRRRGLCLHCGYNLTGNISGRCPECATPCTPRPPIAPAPIQ